MFEQNADPIVVSLWSSLLKSGEWQREPSPPAGRFVGDLAVGGVQYTDGETRVWVATPSADPYTPPAAWRSVLVSPSLTRGVLSYTLQWFRDVLHAAKDQLEVDDSACIIYVDGDYKLFQRSPNRMQLGINLVFSVDFPTKYMLQGLASTFEAPTSYLNITDELIRRVTEQATAANEPVIASDWRQWFNLALSVGLTLYLDPEL